MALAELQDIFSAKLSASSDDPIWQMLNSRLVTTLRPVVEADNARQLRALVRKALAEFVPISTIIGMGMTQQATERNLTGQQTVAEINEGVWEILDPSVEWMFQNSDKRILINVLRDQAELARLADEAPIENRACFLAAIADGFWALRKLDVVLTTVLFVALRELHPRHDKTVRWLCLAARDYGAAWHSALFQNDPLLQERLSRPLGSLQTISSEEMKRRLGL